MFTPQSIRPIPATLNSHLTSVYLVFLQDVTDGHLQYVFLQPLDVFSLVTIIISKFTQNSRSI